VGGRPTAGPLGDCAKHRSYVWTDRYGAVRVVATITRRAPVGEFLQRLARLPPAA
jgi:hypothetical protein